MGCGSSSLKGEKANDGAGGGEADTPARKVRTNFSDVDFAGSKDGRRGTMAVAPDEDAHRRPTKISESSADGVLGETSEAPRSPTKSKSSLEKARLGKVDENAEGSKLEPYKSIETGEQGPITDAIAAQQKKDHTSADLHVGGIPPNDEAAALKTVGMEGANPIKV